MTRSPMIAAQPRPTHGQLPWRLRAGRKTAMDYRHHSRQPQSPRHGRHSSRKGIAGELSRSLRRPLPPALYGRTPGPPVQYRLLHGGGEFRPGFGMSKPERGSSPKLRKNSARERNFPIRECVPQAQCQAEPEVTAARSRNCWPRTWDLRVRVRTSYHFPGERRIVIG